MAFSISRSLKETSGNLTRNYQYSIAAILTVMVSLTLVGSALIVRQGVNRFTSQWQNGIDFKVWMNTGASPSEISAVNIELKHASQVKSCNYVNHQQSYQILTQAFTNNKLITSLFTPQTTPTFYQCVLVSPQAAPVLYKEFLNTPGVMTPQYPQQELQTLERVTAILQTALLVLAAMMLIASVILIIITIRMAIFARRKEIGVMKLVGATNWFIRIPFMFEGIIEGILGAILAALSVFLLRYWLNSIINTVGGGSSATKGLTLLQASVATSEDALITGIVLVILGVGVGSVGSFVGIRRFLDV
jgi:cell division transport system permease protein